MQYPTDKRRKTFGRGARKPSQMIVQRRGNAAPNLAFVYPEPLEELAPIPNRNPDFGRRRSLPGIPAQSMPDPRIGKALRGLPYVAAAATLGFAAYEWFKPDAYFYTGPWVLQLKCPGGVGSHAAMGSNYRIPGEHPTVFCTNIYQTGMSWVTTWPFNGKNYTYPSVHKYYRGIKPSWSSSRLAIREWWYRNAGEDGQPHPPGVEVPPGTIPFPQTVQPGPRPLPQPWDWTEVPTWWNPDLAPPGVPWTPEVPPVRRPEPAEQPARQDRPRPRPRRRPRVVRRPRRGALPRPWPHPPGNPERPSEDPSRGIEVEPRPDDDDLPVPAVKDRPYPHDRRRPRRGEKEIKIKGKTQWVYRIVDTVVGTVTEGGDIIDALWDALPCWARHGCHQWIVPNSEQLLDAMWQEYLDLNFTKREFLTEHKAYEISARKKWREAKEFVDKYWDILPKYTPIAPGEHRKDTARNKEWWTNYYFENANWMDWELRYRRARARAASYVEQYGDLEYDNSQGAEPDYQTKLGDLYRNINALDTNRAIENLVANGIEDAVIGKLSGGASGSKSGFLDLIDRPFGWTTGPGL